MQQMDMNEKGETVEVEGTVTHYHDAGEGPVVLLVHGSGPGVSAHTNWRRVLPPLSREFRVLAPDVLGFGETQPPKGVSYNVETWLGHLTAFLDALGIDRCSVVGNSFGGALALHLAAQSPERIERLVLMGSVGVSFDLTPGLDAAWGYKPSREAMRKLLPLFAHRDGLVSEELIESRYQASLKPGQYEAYSAMFPAPRQRSVDALALDNKTLAGIASETLIVHGRHDKIIPVEVSERLAAVLPKSQLRVIEECGHWVQIEKSDEFFTLVRDFLSDHHTLESTGSR